MTSQNEEILQQYLESNALIGVDFIPTQVLQMKTSKKTQKKTASTTKKKVPQTELKTSSSAASSRGKGKQAGDLEEIRKRHDATCPHCTKVEDITQTVFGEGNPHADLMFIGEAPGAEEDRLGRPFVGRAGQKLDQIIEAMAMTREEIYIANVLKARPPDNRTPLRHEIDLCAPFLTEQILAIAPKVIVTLGGPATKFLLDTNTGITKLRGQWTTWVSADLKVDVMPTFHPAYLLRNYTIQTRQQVWSDMQAVADRLTKE